MSRKLALILACGASLFSFGVQASPVLFAPMQKAAPDIMLVRDWCGLVVPSPVVIAPSPVVVVPAVPVVVAPIVCPYGYVLGPYGRCLPY